jgi:allantoate deiminase/N-carbamoyl-L-amino-acid hydrolase
MISLDELNAATPSDFAAALNGIFEHSPWIAERAAAARPLTSRVQLLEAMCAVVAAASDEEQLRLIRAHPELAGKAAIRNELTAESGREQKGAGLDSCTPEQFARLHQLNAAYKERFGFPFILAVRGHNPASIIGCFEERVGHDVAQERQVAIQQIGRIAGFRLADAVTTPAGAEIMAMVDSLARHSEQRDNLTCSYLSRAHRAAAAQISDWMLAAGMTVEIDAVGNVVGRLSCGQADAKTLMTGSHYDTVIDGGRYDGRLGILLPIVVATQLRQKGVTLPFDLEIIAFGDEEGVRFKSTFIGSSAVAGCFDPAMLDNIDAQGISMRDALRTAGFDPDVIASLGRDPKTLLGYVEVHIEQGPVLLDENRALGVVTGIAGSVRYSVTITGLAGHAGTVPMSMRRDAAAAAAEIVLAVERRCSGTPGLVGTVGRLEVPNGAINVIPGRCELTIDLRAGEDSVRDAALNDVLSEIERISTRRNVKIDLRKMMSASAAPCSQSMQERFARSIARVTGDNPPRCLPSGAGHDAMKMATLTDIGMLFVRCGNGGISHHPDETMTSADADSASRVFEDFLLTFKEPVMTDPSSALRDFIDNESIRQVEFLAELVRVPSDNPPGDCIAHCNRARDLLTALGFEVETDLIPEKVVQTNGMIAAANLLVRRRFGQGGPVIALNAHGDVVPPGRGWTRDPYGAEIIDDPEHGLVMVGRGVAVSKSDFATYAWALLALIELEKQGVGLNGTIELHFTYDEEAGGNIGPRRLIEQQLSKPDLAICAGFSYAVTTAHNGCLHLEVVVNGKSGHAAIPETGIDALDAATQILNALYAFRATLRERRSQVPGINSATLNVGLIQGGINTNVVPDRVTLRLDRRIIPEESVAAAEAELKELIAAEAEKRPGITVDVRRILLAEPLIELPGAARLIASLRAHGEREFGTPIGTTGVPLYTDARHYSSAGIPTVLYGAGPRTLQEANGHGPDECLRLNDLRRATCVVALTLVDLLRGA